MTLRYEKYINYSGDTGQLVVLLLFFISGIDENIIKNCPTYEIRRAIFRGIILLAINILNFLATFYSLYLINVGGYKEEGVSNFIIVLCFVLAFIWSMMIMNLYRLLVAVTVQSEKGVVTLFSTLPSLCLKVVFAALVSLSVSLPITIFFLHKSISIELTPEEAYQISLVQNQVRARYENQLFEQYKIQIHENEKFARIKMELEDLDQTISRLNDLNVSAEKLAPALRRKESLLDRQNEIKGRLLTSSDKLKNTRSEIQKEETRITTELQNKGNLWNELSRILYREKYIFIFVFIVIYFIHLGPLLVRTLSPRGMYSYFVDLQNMLTNTKYGVANDYFIANLSDGRKLSFDSFLMAEQEAKNTEKRLKYFKNKKIKIIKDRYLKP